MFTSRISALCLLVAWGLVAAVPQAFAQKADAEKSNHKAIVSYLDSETSLVAWVDVDKLSIPELKEFFHSISAPPLPDEVVDTAEAMQKVLQECKVDRAYVIGGALCLLGDSTEICALIPCSKPEKLIAKMKEFPQTANLVFHQQGKAVLVALKQEGIDKLVKVNGKASDPLLKAIENCQGEHGLAIAPPPTFIPTVVRMIPPNAASDSDKKMLTTLADMEWASVNKNAEEEKLDAAISFGANESASQFADEANHMFNEKLRTPKPINLLVAKKNRVSISNSVQNNALVEMLSAAQGSAKASQSAYNMKQIALAFHNFADTYKRFPPQSLTDKDGKRLLSWRVMLLPYLEQTALYNQFHLDEPWDSEHNIALTKIIPIVYASPDTKLELGHTRYLAPLTKNSVLGTPGEPIDFSKVTDGTSNTIWLVEVAPDSSVVWTKPDDLVVDDADPLKHLAAPGAESILVGFLDGSVRRISAKISKDTANSLFSINGGEVVSDEQMQPK